MFLSEFKEKWADVDGVRTRYFDEGQGAPIVFIHGGQCGDASGGESAQDFDLNFTPLSKRYRCVAIDRLGQGFTDLPKRDADYTMAASVRHATALLRQLNLGAAHLVGHSRGAYVASRIALDAPELVASAILVDTASAAPGEGRNDVVFACNPHEPGTLESSGYVYENYSYRRAIVTDEWLAMKQVITDLQKNRQASRKMHDDGLLAAQFLPGLVDDRDEMFRRIDADGFRRPVLLAWGYNDPTAPVPMGLRYYDLIARKTARVSMHIFNEAGHFSYRERPEEFNRVIAEFVEGVSHGE